MNWKGIPFARSRPDSDHLGFSSTPIHTLDGQHFAPPKQPGMMIPPATANKRYGFLPLVSFRGAELWLWSHEGHSDIPSFSEPENQQERPKHLGFHPQLVKDVVHP